MYIDARYHIASLAAVLIAIGIGLLVGVALLGGEPLPEHTRKVYENAIARVEKEFKTEREEREQLAEQNQSLQTFAKAALAEALRTTLTGQRVAIISLSDKPDGLVDIRSVVEMGGGEVVATVSLSGIPPLDDETALTMARDFGIVGPEEENHDFSTADLMMMLTKSITLGVYKRGLEAMIERGWVEVEPDLYRITSSTVLVVLGGTSVDEGDDPFESLFLKALVQRGRRVVGCERSDVEFSSMATMRSILMATVDDIDRLEGKFALAACIKGDDRHFGIRDSAEARMPDRVPD
jgi:hypothetical protein